jgi:hypothetical protein
VTAFAAAAVIRILFIGNSLTFVNDLPSKVAELASTPGLTVECQMVAVPDYSLEDHWERGEALRAIRRGGWAFVVLQQGPSALPQSRVQLIDSTKRFDTEIRKAHARTALYMVWPTAPRRGDFPAVIASYTAAAQAVQGILLRVGERFRSPPPDTALSLYGPDGFHPTMAGTALAARIITDELMNCWYHNC